MDQAEFDRLMRRAPMPTGNGAPNETTPPLEGIDPEAFDALLREADDLVAAQGVPAAAPTGSLLTTENLTDAAVKLSAGILSPASAFMPEQREIAEAAFTGGMKSFFETSDFLFGEVAPENRTAFRAAVEKRDAELDNKGLHTGFASGVGQFATAMLGLGKAATMVKAAPWFGAGLRTVAAALPRTAEVAKAATAGAIAFDPHEERLSNLVEDTPLANPVTAWLAASPDDTAAEGRLKAAMESIGLDAAILGTFVGGTKVWKALRAGNAEEAARLAEDMQAAAPAGAVPESRPEAIGPEQATETPTEPLVVDESTIPAKAQDAPTGSPESNGGGLVADAAPPLQDGAGALSETLTRVSPTEGEAVVLLDNMAADADAIKKHGGWYQAIEAGHTFGKGEGVPYAKLGMQPDRDDFMARLVDVSAARLADLKGGEVLADAKVTETVDRITGLLGTDPGQVLGMVQMAGQNATTMVANMEAGYLLTHRLLQDSYAMAARIRLGDFSGFGSRQAAMEAFRQQLALANSVYGSARAMTAASGRAMRRMRMDFVINPAAVDAMGSMDPELMVRLVAETGGDPKALGRVIGEPSLWSKTKDFLSFLLVNSLVSGPKTQLINIVSNGYMVAARPVERLIGSAVPAMMGNEAGAGVFKRNLRQFTYLGSAFTDAFSVARRAFVENDSVLAPHGTEAYAGNRGAVRALGGVKPWTSPANILHNVLATSVPVVGLPTRALGFIDELGKQTTYRSMVLARAHEEALEAGHAGGLAGKALRDHVRATVRHRLEQAFDADGKGTDAAALKEAHAATFQQELAPGSFGRWVQTGADNFFPLKLVLPFVKTPTNILRYGWKLTPGLNVAQREFRDMLTGKMGPELQAQATGQFMLGGLFMGSAAFLVSQGTITGGGPGDYQAAQALRATGWQPYSVVMENEDGTKTYVPFGKADPVAIPFGIMADLMDVLNVTDGEETPETAAAIGGLLVALGKQFADRSYLQGVSQALDALSDPEARLAGYAGQTVANLIPYSAAMRQLNADPHIREAREFTDKLLAGVPGLSDKLPARRDAWGDPVVTRKGLWSSDEDQLVDREMQRLILEGGSGINRPQPVHNGVDLRTITMSDGSNAYETYQRLAGHPPMGPSLKQMVAKRMQTRAYQLAPDGPSHVKGTRLWLLHPITSKYRERAMKMLKRDPAVRDAFRADDLKARQQLRDNRQRATLEKLGELRDAFGAGN